jgi:general secretion pathway protein I
MRRGHASGFTLLEVLVALVVFALTAAVLGAAYINVLISYQLAGRDTSDDLDVGYARQQILTQPDLPTAKAGDEFDDADGRHVKWTADVEPTTTADLFTVTMTCVISAPALPQPRTVTQSFMLLRPTWSDPTDRSTLRQAAATRIAQFQGKQLK